jgi:hypothetical protein
MVVITVSVPAARGCRIRDRHQAESYQSGSG